MTILSFFQHALRLPAKIHLRGLVLILGVLFALVSWRPLVAQKYDAFLFGLSTWLMEAPKGANGILLIDVPQEALHTWQEDINQSGQFGALISNILHSPKSLVGVVLDYPIDARTASADRLLDEIATLPEGDNPLLAQARQMSQRKSFMLEYLRHPRVVVGVYNRGFPDESPYFVNWGKLELLPEWLRSHLWKNKAAEPVVMAGSVVQHHTIYRSVEDVRVLISAVGEEEASAGFVLRMLEAARNDLEGERVWQRDKGLGLGSLELKLSPSGAILPLYGATARMTPAIEKVSMEEALARSSFPPRVYIGNEENELALKQALTTYSLETGMTVHAPWWQLPLERALLIILACYLFFLLPRLRTVTGLSFTGFLLFLLLVVQMVAQATQKLWLPFAFLQFFLVLGHLVILMWRSRREEWMKLHIRADEACLDQARHLIDRGELNEARRQLRPVSTQVALLNALYEISSAYASKRQYQQAIDVLQDLENRNKNFRDVQEKIAALQSMMAAADKPRDLNAPLESTVVLDAPKIEKPVLGRYEIQQELGRGAMGTVFLAYDPKISRQVAVKTLSYHQFQGKELEEIKARFFREAEAAGRLSHPNIVSVFDVGEEHDMAFIAMDFAEGQPLNKFVNKENLLPMFEVYRIVCDVALALDYAHNNHIVHRDIKPGNIMYNAAPYQLKVTDFGIARLVDNSKTSTGEILGSPLYMAPEQLKGKKVNHLADIFSLGVSFYQLLTGHLPFQGENLASLTYEIIHGKHKTPKTWRKELPSSAARIVNQALQKDPNDRYTSAAEMASVIKKAIKRDFAQEAKRAGFV